MGDKNGFDTNGLNGVNGHDHQPKLSSISIHHKRFAYSDKPLYRVYTSSSHFKLVEAETAYEAYEKAAIARPHKIERETFYRYRALDPDMLLESDRGAIEISVQLPDEDEMKTLLFAALGDIDLDNIAGQFEEMAIMDLKRHNTSTSSVELRQSQSAPRPSAQPKASPELKAAAPAPQPKTQPAAKQMDEAPKAESEQALSADEIDALLNGEEI
jgi:hypothetical protein